MGEDKGAPALLDAQRVDVGSEAGEADVEPVVNWEDLVEQREQDVSVRCPSTRRAICEPARRG